MFKARRRICLTLVYVLLSLIFVSLAVFLVPQTKINDFVDYSNTFPTAVTASLFCTLIMIATTLYAMLRQYLEKTTMRTGATAYLTEFTDRLRLCYSMENFYSLIGNVLELKADCSVLYVNRLANYIFYNSPNRITTDQNYLDLLERNFPADWPEGTFFIDENFGIVSKIRKARGFLISTNGFHLFVLCRYTRLFDKEVFPRLYEELGRFQLRSETISSLSEISELSREWEQLAESQRSFLPARMPNVKRLKLAAYFRPLINVSGDYYTVLPIDENKTLVMLGDVSGKGLAAALVMGLVMNTVKTKENKEDLPGMIAAIDKSIKEMHLQDKYTVLFIGIIDTQKMTIRYVNASMSDPIIVTRSPDGYRIKSLSSNCPIVGIIPIDDIEVSEQRLFSGDLIMMASDGVSEVMNEEKVELGDTQLFTDTIKKSASKEPREFIKDITDLVFSYNADTRLHDDLTMLVAKLQG
ncbi:PP2C family protein-serine/threonine phosphatase [uncultured Treponema sp.]|uniref:PP2C family protein-serine/threonine phosphatase n=1 Tax=uncultured Treponema sp. TaxID=162155 RepID=UPI0015B97AA2|nr:SpoIIE family protein phosphatase [uncultured Treponema sp.]